MPTNTPTSTPRIPLQGGFKLLLEQNEELRQRLGEALQYEEGGAKTITEQQFAKGSMFYFRPQERIYVLVGTDKGTWLKFEQSDLANLPTPTPANCDAPQQGGFALVWGNNPDIQEKLGCSTAAEPDLFEGALQPFENGTLLYSQKGLGRGKTIYALFSDGSFERFDDPNQ
jgi:eukaryotic-like serine/threonine-protein kinase